MIHPTLQLEHELLSGGVALVAGMDEVGRGALAGPVSVGVVVVDAAVITIPEGLADSKLVNARAREALAPVVREWCIAHAVGHAAPAEIDEVGIVAAMRRAAVRALRDLALQPDVLILDGSHDWLTRSDDLFSGGHDIALPRVLTRVKADQQCASVAAASIVAKVTRDAMLVELDAQHPGYGLAEHKGYGSAEHREAIARLGASDAHRRSWNLLGP